MKLIYCTKCHDVVKLHYHKRKCGCGQSWGEYSRDSVNATVGGAAIPLGISNSIFDDALQKRDRTGLKMHFEAYVIAKEHPNVKVEK